MIDTSLSLLDRLRTTPHHEGWTRFVTLYTPLLAMWARRAKVPDHEVTDLIQEVFVLLIKKLPEFHYEPRRGRFRGWLRTVTLNRWREIGRLRKLPIEEGLSFAEHPADATESLWDYADREFLIGRAQAILKSDFQPTTWQAFWRVVVDEVPAPKVASELGLTLGAVHAARFRVLSRLKQEFAGLLD